MSHIKTNNVRHYGIKLPEAICCFVEDLKEHAPTRVVVPYPGTFANVDLHPDPKYRKVYVEIFSSGGKPGATWRQVKCYHPPVILGGEG